MLLIGVVILLLQLSWVSMKTSRWSAARHLAFINSTLRTVFSMTPMPSTCVKVLNFCARTQWLNIWRRCDFVIDWCFLKHRWNCFAAALLGINTSVVISKPRSLEYTRVHLAKISEGLGLECFRKVLTTTLINTYLNAPLMAIFSRTLGNFALPEAQNRTNRWACGARSPWCQH